MGCKTKEKFNIGIIKYLMIMILSINLLMKKYLNDKNILKFGWGGRSEPTMPTPKPVPYRLATPQSKLYTLFATNKSNF